MKRRIGIVLLSAITLISGCKAPSSGDGVNLVMDTAEAAESDEVPLHESPEEQRDGETEEQSVVPSREPNAEITEEPAAKDGAVCTEDAAETYPAEPAEEVEIIIDGSDDYFTETSYFSGTLTGAASSASKLEIEIEVPFGKRCDIDINGRVGVYGKSYSEDNSVYAYFADYEYYTDEMIAEMLEGYRDEEFMQESEVTAEKTLDGEVFYLHITRFYEDSGFTDPRSVIVAGTYILESGHHFEWSYIDRGELDFDIFISDAAKSLKSVKFTEYIPDQSEIDQAELDAVIDAMIQAGLIQTEFPWRAEVKNALTFDKVSTLDLRGSSEPNVIDVTVSGENVAIRNMLNVHFLHTGVVGRFGSPVDVSGAQEGAVITFRVDKRNMKNVPMQNLIVLYYNEEDAWYDELPSKVDELLGMVSAEIRGDGCYLLADLYEWYNVWGFPIPEGSEHPVRFVSESQPKFTLDVPAGTNLSWRPDSPEQIYKTQLISQELVSQDGSSALSVRLWGIYGEDAWDYALTCAEGIRNELDIEGVPPEKIEELENVEGRITILKKTPLVDGWLYTVNGLFRWDSDYYISLFATVTVSDNAEYAEQELKELAASFAWWYDNE